MQPTMALEVHKKHSPSSLQYQCNPFEGRHGECQRKVSRLETKKYSSSINVENRDGPRGKYSSNGDIEKIEQHNIQPQHFQKIIRSNDENCSCDEEALYIAKNQGTSCYNRMNDQTVEGSSSKKKNRIKSEDITLWNYANDTKDASDMNASTASSSMMLPHVELNKQISGNYLNDSFVTSSSFSPYITAAISAKSSSLSKSTLNTAATTINARLQSFQDTDDHETSVAQDNTESISFDCNNESHEDSRTISSAAVGCCEEDKCKYQPCACSNVKEGGLVNDAMVLDAATLADHYAWLRAYQHMACATSAKTKTLQSGFESGAEHFCYAQNINHCDTNIGETYEKFNTSTNTDENFSANSHHSVLTDCECVEKSSTSCVVPFLQPRCSLQTAEGHSLQQEFPLAYNVIAPNVSLNCDESSEIRSQSLIQPLQIRLESDESQYLSLSNKCEKSESEKRKLFELVNNHCDQLKRFFNLVPEDEELKSENAPNISMVLNSESRQWQEEGKELSMPGTKRSAVTKSASVRPDKVGNEGGNSSCILPNQSNVASDSIDSSLWSTNEKALKSLAKLKLDIPRVNANSTSSSVHNVCSRSDSASKNSHPNNSIENHGRSVMIHPQKRSLNHIQHQQYFHRCHGKRHGGQGIKSGHLLRATISHKVDIGTIRQHNSLAQKETIYTAWDNHHSHAGTEESVSKNGIQCQLNLSYDGPSSLPSFHVNEVPRPPIPTPDEISRLNLNKKPLPPKPTSDGNGKTEGRRSKLPLEALSSSAQNCTCSSSEKKSKNFLRKTVCPSHSSPVTFANCITSASSSSGKDTLDHRIKNTGTAVSRGDTVRHGNFRYESTERHFYDSPTSTSSNNSPSSQASQRSRPMRQGAMDLPVPISDFSSADVSFNVDSSFSSHNQSHYQTPKDRDGDYSYAYDSSVSPAFIIKYNDAVEDMEGEGEYQLEEGVELHGRENRIPLSKNQTNESTNVENIYEEIRDVKTPSKNSQSISNDDDISSRKSSSVNSDSGIGGFGNKPSRSNKNKSRFSQGTLDIVSSKGKREKRMKAGGKKRQDDDLGDKSNSSSSNSGATSALDNLLFQTAPGMTPSQRRNLRKSLVDEVFEELVQRHHDRVLQQLRLDVDEFIAPNSSDTTHEDIEKPSLTYNSKASHRSSSTSSPSSRLKKCESMDFKDVASISSRSSSSHTTKNKSEREKSVKNTNGSSHKLEKSSDTREGFKSSFLSSAKKYGEVLLNRKYFTKASRSNKGVTEERTGDNKNGVKLREKTATKVKGRPLSALFLSSSSLSKSSNIISNNPNVNFDTEPEDHLDFKRQNNNTSKTDNIVSNYLLTDKDKKLSRSKSTGVSLARRNSDFDSGDSDEEVPSRRLQRSKIIASFLEQLDDNNGIDDDFGDNDEKDVIVESTDNNHTSASLNNNNNIMKSEKT